jgi:hypothetical protein
LVFEEGGFFGEELLVKERGTAELLLLLLLLVGVVGTELEEARFFGEFVLEKLLLLEFVVTELLWLEELESGGAGEVGVVGCCKGCE